MAVTRKGGAGISVVPRVLGRAGFKLLLACSKAPTASELDDSQQICVIFSRVLCTANKIIIIIIINSIITTGTIHATLLLEGLLPPEFKPLLEEGVDGVEGPELGVEGPEVGVGPEPGVEGPEVGVGPELGVEGLEVVGADWGRGALQGTITPDTTRLPDGDVETLWEVRHEEADGELVEMETVPKEPLIQLLLVVNISAEKFDEPWIYKFGLER